jgi:hypothetical protein
VRREVDVPSRLSREAPQALFASKAAEAVRPCTSAAPPKADVNLPPWLPPLSAKSGREQMQQITRADARLLDDLVGAARTSGEMVIPVAFAVFRFKAHSNLVGCSIGRSLVLAPFAILST